MTAHRPCRNRRISLAAHIAPIAALALTTSAAHAATPALAVPGDTELQCPSTLVQAPVPDRIPAGWIVHASAGELPLQRVAFYDGVKWTRWD